jgi:excisionase family DNA binding protein
VKQRLFCLETSGDNQMNFDCSAAKEHIDIYEAARRLGVSVMTLRRCIANRELGCIRIGSGRGRVIISETQLADYITRRTIPAQTAQAA